MAGKLVLYNVGHYGIMSRMMMYNMVCHKGDRCVMILDRGWLSEESEEFIDSVSSVPSFEAFCTYDESEISPTLETRTAEACVAYFDKILSKIGIKIEDADAVYSGFDTIHAFGLYLAEKQIIHTLFDGNMVTSTDGAGYLDKSVYHRLLRDRKAITWNSPLVERVIYTLGHSFDEIKEIMIRNNHPSKNREPAVGKII